MTDENRKATASITDILALLSFSGAIALAVAYFLGSMQDYGYFRFLGEDSRDYPRAFEAMALQGVNVIFSLWSVIFSAAGEIGFYGAISIIVGPCLLYAVYKYPDMLVDEAVSDSQIIIPAAGNSSRKKKTKFKKLYEYAKKLHAYCMSPFARALGQAFLKLQLINRGIFWFLLVFLALAIAADFAYSKGYKSAKNLADIFRSGACEVEKIENWKKDETYRVGQCVTITNASKLFGRGVYLGRNGDTLTYFGESGIQVVKLDAGDVITRKIIERAEPGSEKF